jgi:hypothetical protein
MNTKHLIVGAAILCASHLTLAATNELGWTLDSALAQIDCPIIIAGHPHRRS